MDNHPMVLVMSGSQTDAQPILRSGELDESRPPRVTGPPLRRNRSQRSWHSGTVGAVEGGEQTEALVPAAQHAALIALAYRDHHQALLAFAGRVCGPALAVDVVQDVFVRLWRNPGVFDVTRAPLRTYLFVLTRGAAIDAVRKEKAHRRRIERHARDERPVSHGEEPSHDLLREERSHEVIAALDALDPRQRAALLAAFYGNLTYRQVAGRLGIPEGTAKAHIRSALRALHRMLSEPGGSRQTG